ncbi:MAG: hypothetical protein KDD38_08295 [Bdellovibrionales bacterium]|nr:hypothetical protein [Bdellovibrionales bacterium]
MDYKHLFIIVIFLAGCATYQGKVEKARQLLGQHQSDQALGILEPLAKTKNDDQLVYLFDYATALQASGRYKESNTYFLEADRLSDLKNYLSVTRFGGSLLLSEEFTQYKGEDYERLLINVMASLNYLMLNDRESALVEIRRLNEKLEYYRIEQKKQYEQNTAALYISALLWEAEKNWDSAYIDYERAYKRDPNIGYIREDLVRAARKAGRNEKANEWSKKFGIKQRPEWSDKNMGELVLIYQQGWGPRKAERPRVVTSVGLVSPGFPMLQPVRTNTRRARIEIVEAQKGNIPAGSPVLYAEDTQFIYSVQETSIKTLEDAYGPLIAKRIAAFVAKEAAANAVGNKNETLGAIMKIAMHVADRADLRQWSTLPETFQVAKIYMRPGKYSVNVRGLFDTGQYSGEDMQTREIEIQANQKTFINWRSFR